MLLKVKGFTVVIKYKEISRKVERHLKNHIHDAVSSWLAEETEIPDVIVFDIDKDYQCGFELTKLRNQLILGRKGVNIKL